MRRFSVLALALGLVPGAAYAQTAQPPPPAPAGQPAPATGLPLTTGWIDFGVRGSDVTGDGARYERYRDLGDGAAFETFRFNQERGKWLFNAAADHVGREDQRYRGDIVNPGKLKTWVMWDQIRMLMSRTTETLYVATSPNVFEIDNAFQSAIQGSAPPNLLLEPIFDQNARTFDTKSRRHIFESGLEYLATPELTVKGLYRYIDRDGAIPYGGSFGHSNVVEMPAPVQHTFNDFDAAAEYNRDPVLLRFGYVGSWFHNDNTDVTFDNPFQATDVSGTSSRGRVTLAPSNSFIGVNGSASVRLPYRSRGTAYFSTGSLKDAGDPLVAQTVNSAISPAPVDRATVEGEARTTAVNLTFVSRPNRYFDVNVRFRDYDYDNRTPQLTLLQRVSYDNSVSTASYSSLGAQPCSLVTVNPCSVVTEPFGIGRATFDADVKTSPRAGMTAGVGYSYIGEERTHRIIENTSDHVFRLTFDAVGHQLFSVRTKYEHADRSGDVTDEAERELFTIGEQPGIRHFDIAPRNRNRVTILGSVTPTAVFALNASFAAGKDDYIESLFGLRDNTHQIYGVGVDVVPSDTVTLAGSYNYERYNALSRSRQADPVSSTSPDPFNRNAPFNYDTFLAFPQDSNTVPQVARASRNWATDARDRAHSFIANAHFARVREKFDVNVLYDFNLSRSNYDYLTGPVLDRTLPDEVPVDPTLPPPTALPPTRSELHRGTLDVMYALTPRVSIGLSYWYERYRVEDFTLDFQAQPDMSNARVMLLGYLYEPYTANTVWGRLLFRW
jgi:MtrB/PioB family decaheme-associated outer membrane protein